MSTAARVARSWCTVAVATSALLLSALPASAGAPDNGANNRLADSAADTDFVPSGNDFVIHGRGFGHGHGMSQYGAQGAARQGVGWKRILAFYYPGAERSIYKNRVRVLISADTRKAVVVDPRSGLKVRALAKRKSRQLPARINGAKVKKWRLKRDGKGRTVVAHRSAGRWHSRWKFTGEGQFRAGGQPITLRLPGGGEARYRGRLALAGSAADTVNDVSMEAYIKGVIPREMPASWHPNAVRSQAVAARTYAAYERQHPRAGHYQLCDTTSCQVYGGYDAEHPASNAAVKATKRVILTHGGSPAFTQFGSSSGGWTAANQFSYLPSQEDPWDDWAGNPVHSWQVPVSRSRIEAAWPAIGKLKQIKVPDRSGNGAWGGRVRKVVVIGSAGRATISGDTFRFTLGLRSNWFTFSEK